jgi:hypothetical protein
MTVFRITMFVVLIILVSCDETSSKQSIGSAKPEISEKNDNSPRPNHPSELPPAQKPGEPTQIDPEIFKVQVHGESYTARTDKSGNVSILDYPSLWRGKARLGRIDFQVPDLEPFSKEHCGRLSRMAKRGMGEFVRSAFHSRLIFEMPPFLAFNFFSLVRESAKAVGINVPIASIKNSIVHIHGTPELDINDNAISAIIGNQFELNEQLNLSQRGGFIDETHKAVLVVSGDVICDLIAGDVQMKMKYAISGTTNTVDVVYEPLKIDLQNG